MVAAFITQSSPSSPKNPLQDGFHLVVVCDVASEATMAAVTDYLHETGYLAVENTVHLLAPGVFGHTLVMGLLERDREQGNTAFVMIKDGMLRHYSKAPGAIDFTIHITPFS